MTHSESCRQWADEAKQNKVDSKLPRVEARISDTAIAGGTRLLTFTTREIRSSLKSEGFGVYSILGFTLITW